MFCMKEYCNLNNLDVEELARQKNYNLTSVPGIAEFALSLSCAKILFMFLLFVYNFRVQIFTWEAKRIR